MTWTLVVMSHGRWNYLRHGLSALDDLVGLDFFDRRILSLDGGFHTEGSAIPGQWERHALPERLGLTANLTQAFAALSRDDEWVLWLEEDFVLLDAPLEEMAKTLAAKRDLAQMALVRQPWSPEEQEAGGMLHGPHFQGDLTDEGRWMRHKRIFTLNPFVAHASLLRTLTPGVEESLTKQCRARKLWFGFWGGMEDEPRCLHIGAENGMGSPGWRP